MEVTLFVILFLVATIGWFAYRWYASDAFSQPLARTGLFAPWNIHLLHWGILLLMLWVTAESLFPTTSRLWYSLAIWIPIVAITSFFVYWPCDVSSVSKEHKPGQLGLWVFYGLLAVSVVLTPLYLLSVWHNVNEMHWSSGGEMVRALRDLALEEKDYGKLGLAFVVNKVLFVTSLYWRRQLPWWCLLLVLGLNVFTAASVMEKGYFVFIVVVAAWLLYEQKVLKLWHIGVTVLAALVGAYFFTLIRTYAETDAQDLMSFSEFFAIYVTSSPVAFCYMPESVSSEWGERSFFMIYHILNRLGLGPFEVMERLQPFINVPVETNTYTVMQPFFLDFGYKGLAFFAYAFGIVSGWVYRWHRQGKVWATCVYAIVLTALCTQFHQEELLGNLVQNIQYAFLTVLIAL